LLVSSHGAVNVHQILPCARPGVLDAAQVFAQISRRLQTTLHVHQRGVHGLSRTVDDFLDSFVSFNELRTELLVVQHDRECFQMRHR